MTAASQLDTHSPGDLFTKKMSGACSADLLFVLCYSERTVLLIWRSCDSQSCELTELPSFLQLFARDQADLSKEILFTHDEVRS